MLRENKYYFASVHSFNDPIDSAIEPIYELPSIEKIIENQARVLQDNDGISYEEALKKSEILRALPKAELEIRTNRLREDIRRMLNEEVGVLSLSAKNDNILMWSHYADYHKGFCIEFKRSQKNALGATKPVHYVKEYPFLNYFDDLPGKIVKRMILTKAEDWSYEVEWRGLNTIDTEVYYTDDMITGIIFGLRMPEDHKNEIYRILKDKRHIKFYQAELIARSFKLTINQI